jgi:type IV fimbrial biogenesis protein FimT
MQRDKKMNIDMKRTRGFTLIELMVTLTVATILVTVAIPGFRTIIQNNRATTQSNNLLTAMTLARSEAIKRGIRVSVCSSSDQATCAGSTDWATGWIVFTDDTGTAGTLDGTDVLIRVWDAPKGTPTLTQTVGGNDIQYANSGLVAAAAKFTLSLPGGYTRYLCINATGRSRVQEAACP